MVAKCGISPSVVGKCTEPTFGRPEKKPRLIEILFCLDTAEYKSAIFLTFLWVYAPFAPSDRVDVVTARITLSSLKVRIQDSHVGSNMNGDRAVARFFLHSCGCYVLAASSSP